MGTRDRHTTSRTAAALPVVAGLGLEDELYGDHQPYLEATDVRLMPEE